MTWKTFAVVVAAFTFIPAVFMAVQICGWAGLEPSHFSVIQTCKVTDPPQEVFFGFAVMGFVLGVLVGGLLWLGWRKR